jgi:hypothetical protein
LTLVETVPGETLSTFLGFERVDVARTASVGEGGAYKVKKVSSTDIGTDIEQPGA